MTATDVYRDLLDRGFSIRQGDADRLRLTPFSRLTEADKAAIVRHKPEILELVALLAVDEVAPEEPDEDRAAPRRVGVVHDVPSLCLGPTACAVLGICGRLACLTAAEHETFAVAVVTARAERNPHRVMRLIDPLDISKPPVVREEVDRAA